jgi:hypothetical protein
VSLAELHPIILAAMGWYGGHLYAFWGKHSPGIRGVARGCAMLSPPAAEARWLGGKARGCQVTAGRGGIHGRPSASHPPCPPGHSYPLRYSSRPRPSSMLSRPELGAAAHRRSAATNDQIWRSTRSP